MNSPSLPEKYELQGPIASGGMGTVYKAMHKTLNRTVAVKVLHPQYTGDVSFVKRFQREARAMARLEHENIIRVYDVAEGQGPQYMVMEFFPGKDLKKVIRERGALPLSESLSIVLQAAEALTYVHAEGIIHRDIKPGNIMINAEGKVKLADFGIAFAADELPITATDEVLGTPEYMSPEHAAGEKLDGRSDLYSLGMVFYQILTGKTPFSGLTSRTIYAKLLNDREEFVLSFQNSVPSSIQDLVRILLKKDRRDRIGNAAMLVEQIKALREESSPEAQPGRTLTSVTAIPIDRANKQPPKSAPSVRESHAPERADSSWQYSQPAGNNPGGRRLPISLLTGATSVLIIIASLGSYYLFSREVGSSSDSAESISTPDSPPIKEPMDTRPPISTPISPEISRSEESDAALLGKLNVIEADARKSRDEVARSRSEADRVDARRRVSQIYLKAGDLEKKGAAAFDEGLELKRQKEYEQAGTKFEEAKEFLIRANEEFVKTRGQAQPQTVIGTPLPDSERRSANREAPLRKTSTERPLQPAATSAPPLEGIETLKQIPSSSSSLMVAPSDIKQVIPPEPQASGENRTVTPPLENGEITKQVPPLMSALPSRPDIEVVSELLEKLKGAYEERDLLAILQMSNLSGGRSRILEEIFQNHTVVKVSIVNLSLSNNVASANVVITKLVDQNGQVVKPREEWRSKVIIRKEGVNWGKVVW